MTTHTTTAFGMLLRQYRLAAGFSQEALAAHAGLSPAAVAALESGRRGAPRLETLARLADALHLDPSARQTLSAAVPPAPDATAAADGAHRPLAGTLPAAPTALVGRARDVAAVAQLLPPTGRSRLVTLTGPGGVGKTRLALAVAAAVAPAYPDGVAIVDLAPLRDPTLVPPRLAQALGLREEGGRSVLDLLRTVLEERTLLLVLDNAEQVVEAAPLLSELVAACPQLALLVTSRSALRVRAEQRVTLAPLAVPAAASSLDAVATAPAVELFVARARAVQPDFDLTATNAADVAELCRRLDGLPLALEIAAARSALLPPAALLQRWERQGGVLSRGARDLPARQQTLQATLDWSYDLLTPQQRAIFRRLSVFVGGATLDALAAVADPDGALDVLETVAALLDQSLLRSGEEPEPRVEMLQTVQAYARARLDAAGEAPAVQQAHAAFYLALAEEAAPHLRRAGQAAWLVRLDREHDNLRAALEWTLQQGAAELGWRLGGALWRFWYLQGHIAEGQRWLTRLLTLAPHAAPAESALARAAVLGGAGVFAELQGAYAEAQRWHEESLALRQQYGDRWGVADSLDDLGVLADSQGDVARAAALYEQALAVFTELGDTWGQALVLSNQGYLAHEQGAYQAAALLQERSLALFRAAGDQRNVAFTLNHLGEVCCDQGAYARAQTLCAESLALRQALGDRWGVAIATASLGRIAQARGAAEQARVLYTESLAAFRGLGATWNAACTLDRLSSLACDQAAYAEAGALNKESLALFAALQDAKGRARALTTAAQVAAAQGDRGAATRLCQESLSLYRELGGLGGVVPCLEMLAQVWCGPVESAVEAVVRARVERGVQLWSAMTALRESRGAPRPDAAQEACAQALTVARAVLDAAAVAAAWAQGATLSLEQALDLAAAPEP